MAEAQALVEPFFLPLDPGCRFCLLHRPPTGTQVRGGIVYVHPFAEEMNKSRRMAAIMSRTFARLGYAVLQMDLQGCGDSSGEMMTATISMWRSDIQAAADWMLERGFAPLTMWGLRFGALLAFDWSRNTRTPHEPLLLWQPVSSGEAHLTQFLRIGVAADMLSAGASGASGQLRKRLAAGVAVEVAGYEISPALQHEMDELKLQQDALGGAGVEWFEVVSNPEGELSLASRRAVERLAASCVVVDTHVVSGDPFWSTVEIVDSPGLIDATTRVTNDRWMHNSASTL